MSDKTYAITEVVGTSTNSMDDAIRNGIRTASGSVRNLDWFEVKEVRGNIVNDGVGEFQVVMKLGFRYEG